MRRTSWHPIRHLRSSAVAASLLVIAGLAKADLAAEALFAACPSGLPSVDVQGRPLNWSAWRHTPVLAVIWSPDCGFCQRHNEKLGRLLREMPGAAVIGLAIEGTSGGVAQTVRRRGYEFPVLLDGSGPCAVQPQLTSRRVFPMTCWMGDLPTQPRCIPGEMSEDDLRDLLKAQARSRRHS